MNFKESLKGLGLTDSEISVYNALLELKRAGITNLTKRLKMHRPNIYEALKRLVSKGLVSKDGKEYVVNDPKKLLDYVEVLKSGLSEKKSIISSLLPMITEEDETLRVKIYEGYDALKSVFEEMLRTVNINHCIGAWDHLYVMEWFFKNWHNRRIKQGFNDKMIFSSSGRERGEELNKLPYTEVKYLDKTAHSPTALNVFGNKVFFIIGSKLNPIGIVIEDKWVAKDFLDYFKVLWTNAKE